MKHILTLTTLFLAFSFTIGAQNQKHPEDRDKIKEWRTAFITDKLELTETESQKFWPIYNAREAELRTIRKERKSHSFKNADNLSEAEAEQLILKHFETKQAELNVNQKYFEKLKTAISVTKIVKLPRIEIEFKRTILQKLRGAGSSPRGEGRGRE